MRTPATLNSMHGRVSSRLSLSSSSCSPHRCFAQIHYKVDWLRNDATIFYWIDTTISCARHASSKNFTVLFLWGDDVHAGSIPLLSMQITGQLASLGWAARLRSTRSCLLHKYFFCLFAPSLQSQCASHPHT